MRAQRWSFSSNRRPAISRLRGGRPSPAGRIHGASVVASAANGSVSTPPTGGETTRLPIDRESVRQLRRAPISGRGRTARQTVRSHDATRACGTAHCSSARNWACAPQSSSRRPGLLTLQADAAAVAAAAAAAVAAAAAAAVHRAALQGSATRRVMRSAAGVGAADAAAAARKRRARRSRRSRPRRRVHAPAAAADAPAAPGPTGRPGSHRLHHLRSRFAAASQGSPPVAAEADGESTVNAAPCACIDGEVRAHRPGEAACRFRGTSPAAPTAGARQATPLRRHRHCVAAPPAAQPRPFVGRCGLHLRRRRRHAHRELPRVDCVPDDLAAAL